MISCDIGPDDVHAASGLCTLRIDAQAVSLDAAGGDPIQEDVDVQVAHRPSRMSARSLDWVPDAAVEGWVGLLRQWWSGTIVASQELIDALASNGIPFFIHLPPGTDVCPSSTTTR